MTLDTRSGVLRMASSSGSSSANVWCLSAKRGSVEAHQRLKRKGPMLSFICTEIQLDRFKCVTDFQGGMKVKSMCFRSRLGSVYSHTNSFLGSTRKTLKNTMSVEYRGIILRRGWRGCH